MPSQAEIITAVAIHLKAIKIQKRREQIAAHNARVRSRNLAQKSADALAAQQAAEELAAQQEAEELAAQQAAEELAASKAAQKNKTLNQIKRNPLLLLTRPKI
jgi:hypothetical protein